MIFVNHNMDIGTTNVAEMTGVLLRTVRKIKKLLCETSYPQNVISCKKVSQENVRKVRTTEFINKVQMMVDDNSSMSLAYMAHELQCTDKTVRSHAMEDLHCSSYRVQTGQLLIPKMKGKRLLKTHKLIRKLKHPKELEMPWFFSNEKKFCQDQIHNKQNDCWIAVRSQDMPRDMKTKFQAMIMVFGIVSSKGGCDALCLKQALE